MTVSDTFPNTTFRVTCNNFRVEQIPPVGDNFDIIKAIDHFKGVPES